MNAITALAFANAMALGIDCPAWAMPNLFLGIAALVANRGSGALNQARTGGLVRAWFNPDGTSNLLLHDPETTPSISLNLFQPLKSLAAGIPVFGGAGTLDYSDDILTDGIYSATRIRKPEAVLKDFASAQAYIAKDRRLVCAIKYPGMNQNVWAAVCDAVAISNDISFPTPEPAFVWTLHDAISGNVIVIPDALVAMADLNSCDCIPFPAFQSARSESEIREVPREIKFGTDLFMMAYTGLRFGGGVSSLRWGRGRTSRYTYDMQQDFEKALKFKTAICSYAALDSWNQIQSYGVCEKFEYLGDNCWRIRNQDGDDVRVYDRDLILSTHPLTRWLH